MDLRQILDAMTPDICQRLKQAVELGRWPDGHRLTAAQRELCLRAVIAYDFTYKPEAERIGYIHTEFHPHCGTGDAADAALALKPIKWQR